MKKIKTTNHKITAALLVAVMMLSVIFTAVFGGSVKAKAESTTKSYEHDFTGGNLTSDDFFTMTSASISNAVSATIDGKVYDTGMKMNSKGKISFTAKNRGKLTILCGGPKSGSKIKITIDGTASTPAVETAASNGTTAASEVTADIDAGKSVVISKGTNEVSVFKVIFETTTEPTEPTKPTEPTEPDEPIATSYTVTVKDGSNETPYTDLTEGVQQTITATGDDFAYWVNSNGRIVSTENPYTFNVYYSDTYTAVYNDTTSKKVVFMTAYAQIYETVIYDENSFSDSKIPAVPTRYGYTSNGWDKDVEAIKSALESSDYVEVNPKYETNAQETYRVKINSAAVGESYTVNGTTYKADVYYDFPVNTIISVTMADPDNYTCWVNNSNTSEELSYNATYTFFVNRDIQINVKKRDINKAGLITLIKADTNSDGDKVIIYEFTVPEGYSIEFAGVLGDTRGESYVNDKTAKYVGGRASSAITFRYTLTIDSSLVDSLYIMPILKYNNGTTLETVYGTVQKASAVK